LLRNIRIDGKEEKMIQRYFAGDLRPDQEKSWKAEDGLFILYANHLTALAEKELEIKRLSVDLSVNATMMARQCDLAREAEREALSSKWKNDEWAKDVLRLTETIKYLCGIAVKGEGREINEDETVEQFVLSYVKKCEQQIVALKDENERLRKALIALLPGFSKVKDKQIAALQEREKVLVARLHTHGDIETDKEDALRGGEEQKEGREGI